MKRALILLLLLTACGTSPEPGYYDLAAVNGTPHPGTALAIKIQRPTLPDYLDRPDIVREESTYEYKIDEMHRWAEPLDRMFERILVADLRQRLPDSRIFSESDTGTVDSRYIVETGIARFNATGKDKTDLNAVLTITERTAKKSLTSQTIELTESSGVSPDVLAASLSKLIAAYADRVTAIMLAQTASASH